MICTTESFHSKLCFPATYCLISNVLPISSATHLGSVSPSPTRTLTCSRSFQLQRLKRSLSFKSVMRSKSVDNFFQRSNGDSRPPCTLIIAPSPSPPPPALSESPLAYERSPALSPAVSPNPSLSESSRSPSVSPSPSLSAKVQLKSPASSAAPLKTHSFHEHVFRRPTSCERCKHVIQGECPLIYDISQFRSLTIQGRFAELVRSFFSSFICALLSVHKSRCVLTSGADSFDSSAIICILSGPSRQSTGVISGNVIE